MDRRQFLAVSLTASAATALGRPIDARRRAPGKRVLVLGGTDFLGPALVDALIVGGHHVTLFNRGITNPGLFPYVEKVRGLRSANAAEENFSGLSGRTWDAIVDVWPFDPTVVESAAHRLGRSASHYLYVSSIAAYDARDFAQPGITEDAALNRWDPAIRPYDRGKAESERRLQRSIAGRLTIVRPGPIKGSRDTTPDLLTWLRRAQRGGRHIGPGDGNEHVQFVDVKDVARFLVMTIERSLGGVYNVTGVPMTFHEFVGRCNEITRSDAEYVWIPRDFLHAQGLDPAPFDSPTIPFYLGKFPSWHPEPERRGLRQISSEKAFRAGWKQRPFDETAIDYLSWIDSLGPTYEWSDELSADVEAAVIRRYLSSGTRPPLRR